MKKRVIFTIVTKNYIGLAYVLRDSIRRHTPDVDFRVVVADEVSGYDVQSDGDILIAKDVLSYSGQEWTEMAFKYNLTEFCTAIKPAAFQYLFGLGYDEVMYFDPDIYTFSSLLPLFERLSRSVMLLTPHVVGIHPHYGGQQEEWTFNANGIFNLGFCAMRKSADSDKILDWWRSKLFDNAFTDRSVGNFTDQKWMDWAPALLGEKLDVVRDLGVNVAPWNYFEREILQEGTRLTVRFREESENSQASYPLVFVHYSGYDYRQLLEGRIHHARIDVMRYPDIQLLHHTYTDVLVANKQQFLQYIALPYSYATYSDGSLIDGFHRRLYHGMLLKGLRVNDPFSVKGDFYPLLRKRGLLSKQNTDKFTPANLPGIEDKKAKLNRFYRTLFSLIGYKRYPLFLKSLYMYCRPENHTFLIKK